MIIIETHLFSQFTANGLSDQRAGWAFSLYDCHDLRCPAFGLFIGTDPKRISFVVLLRFSGSLDNCIHLFDAEDLCGGCPFCDWAGHDRRCDGFTDIWIGQRFFPAAAGCHIGRLVVYTASDRCYPQCLDPRHHRHTDWQLYLAWADRYRTLSVCIRMQFSN